MSEQQSQTTTGTPSETQLCKMGCGFFGNGTTGGCCSKCWRDAQKKLGNDMSPVSSAADVCRATTTSASPSMLMEEAPEAMDIETEHVEETMECESPAPVAPVTMKKKKKKASYKSMMANMMHSTQKDVEQEKAALRKVTGGGAFSKIDKI